MIEQLREAHFPGKLDDEVTVTAVSRQTFYEVTNQLYQHIFTPLGELGLYQDPTPQNSLAKTLAGQIHAEYFVFYTTANEPVGFSMGKVVNGQTFFMEWSGILPAYQRRGLYSRFLDVLIPYLQALGIDRVTSNHMGNNRPVLIAKLKAGFIITGMTLDERHGMLVWLARFLSPERQHGFESAFSLPNFG
ncbi:MAG: GNAT family N-acetyltransferase [Anaerolineaceae bacterium]|nr:GNAT family N-acetyltransferase [Anaerolineaceae bacterium]